MRQLRMVIEYDDGPAVGTCSLNCTVAILTALIRAGVVVVVTVYLMNR